MDRLGYLPSLWLMLLARSISPTPARRYFGTSIEALRGLAGMEDEP